MNRLITQGNVSAASVDDLRDSVSCLSAFDADDMLDDWAVYATLIMLDERTTVQLTGTLVASQQLTFQLASAGRSARVEMAGLHIAGNSSVRILQEIDVALLMNVSVADSASLWLSEVAAMPLQTSAVSVSLSERVGAAPDQGGLPHC